MKRKRDSIISYLSSRPVPANVRRDCADAYRRNKKLFGSAPSRVNVVIAHTLPEWRVACREYYFPIAKAAVLRDGTLVLKSRQLMDRTPTQYRQIIRHEMNHVFWCKLFRSKKNIWVPFWLLEGLACLTANNDYLLSAKRLAEATSKSARLPLPYRYTTSAITVKNSDELALLYSYWTHFALWLSQSKPRRLVQFMRAYARHHSKENYYRSFVKTFGISEQKAQRDFEAYLVSVHKPENSRNYPP